MRAAIYVRQSLDANGEGAAVARQEKECRTLAARRGWDVIKVYSDNDMSATNGKIRPGWRALLADLADGQYDVLVCWHTDRLYRRLLDLVELTAIADRQRLQIAAVTAGEIDLSTASGQHFAEMLASAAKYEVKHKSERQKAANLQRAARGDVKWAKRPFGYRLDDERRIVADPAEARELRKAAKRLLAGEPASRIIADLNRRGVTTSYGHPWSAITLRRCLTNPRLIGRAVSLGVDYGQGDWPAILDADVQAQLVALYANRHRRPLDWTPKYLLSGIALCGVCAAAGTSQRVLTSVASTTKGKPRVYRCPETHLSRRVADVDRVVSETIIARLSRRDAAKLFAPDVDLDGLRGHATELRARRDGLAALLADGLLSADAVTAQAERLTTEIDELTRKIATAEQGLPPGFAESIGTRQVRQVWERATLTRQRELIDTLAEITIQPAGRQSSFDPAQIKIDWKR
jgi:site-specific DNA recombinase